MVKLTIVYHPSMTPKFAFCVGKSKQTLEEKVNQWMHFGKFELKALCGLCIGSLGFRITLVQYYTPLTHQIDWYCSIFPHSNVYRTSRSSHWSLLFNLSSPKCIEDLYLITLIATVQYSLAQMYTRPLAHQIDRYCSIFPHQIDWYCSIFSHSNVYKTSTSSNWSLMFNIPTPNVYKTSSLQLFNITTTKYIQNHQLIKSIATVQYYHTHDIYKDIIECYVSKLS